MKTKPGRERESLSERPPPLLPPPASSAGQLRSSSASIAHIQFQHNIEYMHPKFLALHTKVTLIDNRLSTFILFFFSLSIYISRRLSRFACPAPRNFFKKRKKF